MMGSVRFHFLSLLSALLILGSNAALSEGLPWKTIAPPKKDFQLVVNSSELKVRGPVNTEEIGKNQAGAVNIQYQGIPGAGPAGLIGQLLIHGLIVAAGQDSKKTELDAQAAAFGSPYLGRIVKKTELEFIADAIENMPDMQGRRVLSSQTISRQTNFIELNFVLTVSADHMSLGGRFSFTSFEAGKAGRSIEIAIINEPVRELISFEDWAQSNRSIPLEFRNIAIEAIRIFHILHDLNFSAPVIKSSTVRYWDGSSERYERAELLGKRCGRLLVRNLRGGLMVVSESNQNSSAIGCSDFGTTEFK